MVNLEWVEAEQLINFQYENESFSALIDQPTHLIILGVDWSKITMQERQVHV